MLCSPMGGPKFPTKNAFTEKLLLSKLSLFFTVFETAKFWGTTQEITIVPSLLQSEGCLQ